MPKESRFHSYHRQEMETLSIFESIQMWCVSYNLLLSGCECRFKGDKAVGPRNCSPPARFGIAGIVPPIPNLPPWRKKGKVFPFNLRYQVLDSETLCLCYKCKISGMFANSKNVKIVKMWQYFHFQTLVAGVVSPVLTLRSSVFITLYICFKDCHVQYRLSSYSTCGAQFCVGLKLGHFGK
jgi:hypothetical protein